MAATSYQPRDADIDIGRLFAALWRDKWLILFAALGFAVIVAIGLSMMTPQYRADARVLIDTNESVFTRPEQDRTVDQMRLDQEAIASQVEIITSTDLLLNVADELDLASNSEFDTTLSMSAFGRGLALLGIGSQATEMTRERRVLANMRERLRVSPVNDSRVIVIEFRSSDPALAAQVANTIAQSYVALESRAQLQTTGAAAEYLAAEIAQLQGGVREAEARVAAFRAANGLLVGQNDAVLATQQLAELSTELSAVRADRASVEARVRSVETALASGASVDTLPDVIQSPLIARLSEQRANLTADMADLSTTFLPGHPRMQALQSQIAGLDAQIRSQAQNVLAGLRNEAAIARDSEEELTGALNTLKAASADANDSEVELRALEREADAQRALLESYLLRFREAQARDQTQYAPAKARVISSATEPLRASFPRMGPMVAASFFVGLILMVVVTLMRELFSGRALVPAAAAEPATRSSGDDAPVEPVIEQTVVAPSMMEPGDPMPRRAGNALLSPLADTATPVANDNFTPDAVADKLIRRGAGRVLVLSCGGETSADGAVGLARLMSGRSLRTILVDLSGNGMAGVIMTGDPDGLGITDLLAADAAYSDIIHPDIGSGAHVVPMGAADAERAARGIARLPIILDGLSEAYDAVIVDCGMTDALGLERLVSQDSEVVLAVDAEGSHTAVSVASDLARAGHDDVLMLLPEPVDPDDPVELARISQPA